LKKPKKNQATLGLVWHSWCSPGRFRGLHGTSRPRSSGKVVEKTVEKTVTVVDTVYVEQVQELQKSFNATQFEQGKTALSDDAKEVLFKLVEVMKQTPDMKLKVEGHTSSEGTDDVNQLLSEARAKAVVEFLISRGIEPERLSYEGLGSSRPINAENPEAPENRRTEFIVTDEFVEAEPEAAAEETAPEAAESEQKQ